MSSILDRNVKEMVSYMGLELRRKVTDGHRDLSHQHIAGGNQIHENY